MRPAFQGARRIERRSFLLAGWLALAGAVVVRATPIAASAIALALPRVPTTYYVDNAGSDSNPGTSLLPWQHCSKVNSTGLVAGDQVIFTAGQTFTGPLTIANNGTAGNYICIGTGRLTPSTAGTGRTAQSNPATITCPDGGNGVNVTNAEYVSLDNLIVTGSGVNTSTGVSTSTGRGINLSSTQTTNKLNSNRLTACTVTGCKDGIFATTTLASQKGYADLQMWGCDVHACQRVGVLVVNFDGVFSSGSATQNSDLYVGYCQVYDCPGLAGGTGVGNCGEGISIHNVTTGTVEYCTVHDMNIVGDQGLGGTAGLTATVADAMVFQFNEVYNVYARQPTPTDGCGIDFETGANNCVAQYNYIHDNDGAGYLNGSTVSGLSANLNIVRFNVFARNCATNQAELNPFGSTFGNVTNTTFYNNTIYASHGDVYNNAVAGTTVSIDAIVNNILVSKAGSFCVNGTVDTANLFGNLYFAIGGGGIKIKPNGTTYTSMATLRGAGYEVTGGTSGVNADPLLVSPALGVGAGSLPGQAVTTMSYFDALYASPARDAGVDISGVVTLVHDFHNIACSGHGANIGACIPQPVNVRLPIRAPQ